jgi:hypothetical protein
MFRVIQGKLGIIHNEEEIVLTPDMSTLVVKPGVRYASLWTAGSKSYC